MNDYKYKVSVVMPLYNVANYLDEAIDSIVNQTIGFEENIQLVLVNDGSPDNVSVICQKYKEQYPDNVVYLEQPNSGVSAARNNGIQYIEGKYVNFFDGDDKWDKDAYRLMYNFIEENSEEIDFVAARIAYFGRRNGFKHPLEYKFETTRIVDIVEEYDCVQLSTPTVLIKSNVVISQGFDTRIKFSEDSIYITQIVLDKMAYGVIREAVYHYRKRDVLNSAIDVSSISPEWYFDTPKYSYNKMITESINRKGVILPYIQYLIMYDLQWRLGKKMPDFFSADDREKYIRVVVNLLSSIEDRIIAEQKNLNIALKVFALSLKYRKDIRNQIYLREQEAFFNDAYLFNVRARNRLTISNLKIRDDILYIEGYLHLHILSNEYCFAICDNKGNEYPIEYYRIPNKDIVGFTGDVVLEGRGFRTEVPLGKVERIDYILKCDSGGFVKLAPSYGKFAKLDREQKNTYYSHGKWIVEHKRYGLNIIEKSISRSVLSELRYVYRELLPQRKYGIVFTRIVSLLMRFIKRKRVWILSDRTNAAGDNGEALFSYITDNELKGKVYYFAIDKSSSDYKRLKKKGSILKIGSYKYRLKFVNSDKIISAHADDWVINAFAENEKYIKGLYDFDYVFLQHGITKDDLSSWLHKTNRDISLFITAARKEYHSIVNGTYGYTEKEVVLSGFPRYDKLISEPKKKLVFLPTWRKDIAEKTISGSSERPYSESFKESNYYEFYNRMINDESLIRTMKEYGFEGEFYNHPAFFSQANDFKGNDTIKVVNDKANYQNIFRENALLITDYSSVAFDFSYMKKPVVYCQFDRDSFFKRHTYKKGYFDYEEDGFGPVCYSFDETIKMIIEYIKNGCQMEDIYRQRVNEFFRWDDKNNCKRVYDAIEAIGDSRK